MSFSLAATITSLTLTAASLAYSIYNWLTAPEAKPPPITNLDFQSSAYGGPVAVLHGTKKLAGNMIWLNKSIPVESGQGGGGGGKGNTAYIYVTSMAFGLCMRRPGATYTLKRVWNGKNPVNMSIFGPKIHFYDGTQTTADTEIGKWIRYIYDGVVTGTSLRGVVGDILMDRIYSDTFLSSAHPGHPTYFVGGTINFGGNLSRLILVQGNGYVVIVSTFPAALAIAGDEFSATPGPLQTKPPAPVWKNLVYVVLYNWATQGPMIPNFTWEISDGSDDQTPQFITKDILTNDLYGLGLPELTFINSSEYAISEAFATEHDLLMSMVWNQRGSVLDALNKVIQHHDGLVTYYDGKISHKQITMEGALGVQWYQTISDDFSGASMNDQWAVVGI
jgi:hypothetical protein